MLKFLRLIKVFCHIGEGAANKLLDSRDYPYKNPLLFRRIISKINLKHCSKGAILIEFAVCTPILIILMFYISDVIHLKRWYRLTNFVGLQAVNMIQNVSQGRSSSQRAITQKDLKYIYSAAFLTIYPDTNFCDVKSAHKYGHWGEIFLYYVKGNSDGTASVMWCLDIQVFNSNRAINSPEDVRMGEREESNDRSLVTYKKNIAPSAVYPTFKIKKNEVKMILEVCMDYSTDSNKYKLVDGSGIDTVSYDKILGFYLLKPKYRGRIPEERTCFNSVIIFSPSPDLFTETIPQ